MDPVEAPASQAKPRPIATLREGPLHAALKALLAEPGDRVEEPVDGYQVDLVRGDLLVEIQTRSFASAARKLRDLVTRHRVRLVHPIPRERVLVKLPKGRRGSAERRRSPLRGGFERVFDELVSIPELLAHENFELELVATREEEIRRHRPERATRGAWRRRGWVVEERRLVEALDRRLLCTPHDLLALLPADAPDPFRARDLARGWRQPLRIGQRAAYCLRKSGAAVLVGKDGNTLVYRRVC